MSPSSRSSASLRPPQVTFVTFARPVPHQVVIPHRTPLPGWRGMPTPAHRPAAAPTPARHPALAQPGSQWTVGIPPSPARHLTESVMPVPGDPARLALELAALG